MRNCFRRSALLWLTRTGTFALLALCSVAAAEASAPICKEPSGTPGSLTALDCDMRYRDTVVTCDTFGTTPPCPKQPMAMKDTPRKSFIEDFSPYLYIFAPDPDNKSKAYTGSFYRGTPGDSGQTFQIFGAGGASKNLAPCVRQVKLSSKLSPEDQAKMMRLQLDNCANQYILHTAIYPQQKEQKEETRLPSLEDPKDASKKVNLESHCQPLRIAKDTKQEYLASAYLEGAWKKLLLNPAHRMNADSPAEPHLPTGMTLENTDNPNVKLPQALQPVTLAQIGSIEFEEINDPSHPFSPRWDFKWNERDHYSPKTQAYGGDPKNAVFCAGDKDKNIAKVDILSFREARLKFDKKVNDRISFNKNCLANSGMQKNPCCLVNTHGSPYVANWTCDVQPCAKCYAGLKEKEVKGDKPVCKTDYKSKLDRNFVKPPFLPVNPILRVGPALSDIDSLASIAGLPTTLPIDQAKALIASQIGLLSKLSPNLTLAQALPFLSNQLNTLNRLSNLTSELSLNPNLKLDFNQLANITALQASITGRITSQLPFEKIQQSLGNVSNIIASLDPNVALQKALTPLNSLTQSLLQYPKALIGDARQSIYTGLSVINKLPQQLDIPSASQLLNQELGKLSGVNQALTVAEAIKSGAIQSSAIIDANIPSGMKVGELTEALKSTSAGISQFSSELGNAQAQLGGYVSQLRGVAKQLDGFPAALSATEVGQMLGDLRNGIQGIAGNGLASLNQISGGLEALGKLDFVSGITNSAQISALLGQTSQLVAGLSGNVNSVLAPINGALGSINGQINGVIGNINGQISGVVGGINNQINGVLGQVNSQIGNALGQITGALPLKQLDQLTSVLKNQLSALTKFANTPLFKFIPDLTKQLEALNKFAGQLSLGSIAGKLGIGLPQFNGVPCTVGTDSYQFLCVVALPYQFTAKCNPNEFGPDNSDTMANLCKQLRAPVTMLNKLKMRYHNPEDKSSIVLKNGVQEGLSFKDYFDDKDTKIAHMPYPRLWDTGRSIQNSVSTDQVPTDFSGQYTAIVGVGREASPDAAATPVGGKSKRDDERCLYGGWGKDTHVAGVDIKVPDPVTSWTELKLYQARTLRYFGLSCFGRYEKLFKPGSTEGLGLSSLGGEWGRTITTTCDAEGKNCRSQNRFGKEGDVLKGQAASDKEKRFTQLLNENWPLGWRGYLSSSNDKKRFPDFGGSAKTLTGLDKAEEGDIVIMPKGASDKDGKLGLPRIGVISIVSLGSDCQAKKNCYVQVLEADNGKWPDVCGTTASFNEVKTRNLFRPGALAQNVKDELEGRVKWTTSCEDPGLLSCEMSNWNDVKLYRARDNIRKGCGKTKSSECANGETP